MRKLPLFSIAALAIVALAALYMTIEFRPAPRLTVPEHAGVKPRPASATSTVLDSHHEESCRYVNSKYGYRLSIPCDWIVSEENADEDSSDISLTVLQ